MHSCSSTFLRRSTAFLVTASILLSTPLSLFAAPVADVLRTSDSALVTRGEFIQAATTLLSIPAANSVVLPYKRVPTSLLSAVKSAYAQKALTCFGSELYPARSITRGEVLQVIAALQNLTASPSSFRDARQGGDALARAVQVAIDNDWMTPRSSVAFGVNDPLTGNEARIFLRKVMGEGGTGEQQGGGKDSVPTVRIQLNPSSLQTSSADLPKAQVLQGMWRIVNDDYLYQDRIKQDDAAYAAAEAMIKSLADPYTTFYRPEKTRDFQSRLNGEVSGIGAQVEDREGVLTVVTPLSGSPAEKAGLLPGDQIIAVDGVSLDGLSFEAGVDKVRGPSGSTVKLTIRRSGNEFDISVVRQSVKVPEISITWQGEIAVIKLMQFGKLADTELPAQMKRVAEQDPQGIILDLRNNPGGLLHASATVASNFLPQGSVVAVIKARSGVTQERTETAPTIADTVPMVVLVNKGSASAAEIVAGALQDADRATIVGEQTFGKGTVQEVLEFNDHSSLKLTIAEWLTPKERKIDGIGVKPDVVVPLGDRDMQMQKALSILQGGRR